MLFFFLAFAVMRTLFFTVATAVSVRTPLGYGLALLGTYSPGLVALWLTARAEGSVGVRALLGRIAKWQVPARWYLFSARTATPGGTGTFGWVASPVAWLTVVLLWICAVYFLARMPKGNAPLLDRPFEQRGRHA